MSTSTTVDSFNDTFMFNAMIPYESYLALMFLYGKRTFAITG